MPIELGLSVVLPMFREISDVMSCGCHRAEKLFEDGVNLMESVLENTLNRDCLPNAIWQAVSI